MTIRHSLLLCIGALVVATAADLPAQAPPAPTGPTAAASQNPVMPRTRATGDQRRQYLLAPTGQPWPYRLFVPPTWDGKASLPLILMLHGGGANENKVISER